MHDRRPRLDPKGSAGYFGRGLAYRNRGEYDKAIAGFTEAIRLDRKDASAFRWRGRAYEKRGDRGKAIADFTDVIRLNPNDAQAYYWRGGAYQKEGDCENSSTTDVALNAVCSTSEGAIRCVR